MDTETTSPSEIRVGDTIESVDTPGVWLTVEQPPEFVLAYWVDADKPGPGDWFFKGTVEADDTDWREMEGASFVFTSNQRVTRRLR